jgi:hypothetical protein
MRKQTLFTLLLFSFFIFGISLSHIRAQETEANSYGSSRLNNLSRELVRQTVDLVDRTREAITRSNSNSRTDLENAFLAAQIDAAAHLFDDMVRNKRRAAELRDGIWFVADLARRAPSYGSESYLWRDVQRSISDIQRELGSGGGYPGDGNQTPGTPVSGRVFWRGRVDIETQLHIRANDLETRVVAGPNWGGESFNFTSPLPARRVTVEVNTRKGRGNVRVIQQPSRDNNFTAVIQILDPKGGAGEYDLDIFWR